MADRALIPAALAALLLASPAAGQAGAPAILWEENTQGGELRVCGLAAGRLAALDPGRHGDVLEVRAVDPALPRSAGLPPLWGSFAVEEHCLLFRPRHRPSPGMDLEARFRGELFDDLTGGRGAGGAGGTPDRELRVAAAATERKTRVEAIFPSGEEVPANLLRLYVSFSGPMSLKGIEKHVRLLDAAGAEIATAFVEVPDGLWDPGRRRLTLILHPGRVKSGIAVGETLGPVLEPGAEVTLEIGDGARDAGGAQLAEGARRTWRIGPPQKEALDASSFRLAAGEAALEIGFPVALDRALALSSFSVRSGGEELAGSWELEPGERLLRFRPAAPWRRGQPHVLAIGDRLEDLAGNRLGRAFEAAPDDPAKAAAAAFPFVP